MAIHRHDDERLPDSDAPAEGPKGKRHWWLPYYDLRAARAEGVALRKKYYICRRCHARSEPRGKQVAGVGFPCAGFPADGGGK